MDPTPTLDGKAAVVTGASAGIGYQAALALAQSGALVLGVGRSPDRCRAAEAALRAACPGAQVAFLTADLALQSEVRQLATEIGRELDRRGHPALDVLVNNAGIYSGKYVRTVDGVELTLAVNHLAPFLLTHELRARLAASPAARVLTVSSGSHYRARLDLRRLNAPRLYFGLWAYQQSKLANVLFTGELNRRSDGARLRAFAVDPGLVNTEIGLKDTGALARLVWRLRRRSGVAPQVPARTILYLSREPALQDAAEIYWRDCRPLPPSPLALDTGLATGLWELSSVLCGIDPEGMEAG